MPETPKKLKVFLCHSSQDKSVVRELYNKLSIEGWMDVWLDEIKLYPGDDWNLEIERAVEESDVILVCLTKSSVTKEGYVQRELRAILDVGDYKPEGTLYIIPVRLEACELPRRLRPWQSADYFPQDNRGPTYERLLVNLRKCASERGIFVDEPKPKLPLDSPPNVGNKAYRLYPLIGLLALAGLAVGILWITSPRIGSTMISPNDDMVMVYVPAGEFTMGSDTGSDNEKPIHTVYLDAFWIDQTEVTNAMYAQCVLGGECDRPISVSSNSRQTYFGNSAFNNYPVINVSWNDAQDYCAWADRRLPTEAEWEKAARGVDGNVYPWGNNAPNKNLLNYSKLIGDTTEVGAYSDSKSIYGAYDMAGNVWEWVNDWYDKDYYNNLQWSNPSGPISGQDHVLRGGAWDNNDNEVRSAIRYIDDPPNTLNFIYFGFRCALSK